MPKRKKLYAFHALVNGGADYVGEVIEERVDTIRLEVVDAVCSWAGMWSPSGELRDFPKSECRIFNDAGACLATVHELNERVYRQRKEQVVL